MGFSERRIEVEPGLRLFCRMQGDGPETILIPGAAQLAEDLELLARNRTIIFFDQRNRGQSDRVDDPARLSVTHEVSDLEALRRGLALERFALLGWSYQSGVATMYALEHPERVTRLMLVGPMPPHKPHGTEATRAWTEADQRIDPAALQRLNEMRSNHVHETDPVAYCRQYRRTYVPRQMGRPAALARMRTDPCRFPNEHPDRLYPLLFQHVMPSFGDWDWRPRLASLTVPVLVLCGGKDLVPVELLREWTQHLPDSRLLLIPDVGHLPWLEEPELFFAAIDSFLSGVWPPSAEPGIVQPEPQV